MVQPHRVDIVLEERLGMCLGASKKWVAVSVCIQFFVLREVSGQENPSVEEVVAGFQQNFYRFGTLRVTGYRLTFKHDNSRRRMLQQGMQADEIEAIARKKYFPMQLWTDREGLQIRWPRASESVQSNAEFPFPT